MKPFRSKHEKLECSKWEDSALTRLVRAELRAGAVRGVCLQFACSLAREGALLLPVERHGTLDAGRSRSRQPGASAARRCPDGFVASPRPTLSKCVESRVQRVPGVGKDRGFVERDRNRLASTSTGLLVFVAWYSDCAGRWLLRSGYFVTRLETRTKESNMCASQWDCLNP